MEETEARECVLMFCDVLRLLQEGKPIPLEFLKKKVSAWKQMTEPKPSNPPPAPEGVF